MNIIVDPLQKAQARLCVQYWVQLCEAQVLPSKGCVKGDWVMAGRQFGKEIGDTLTKGFRGLESQEVEVFVLVRSQLAVLSQFASLGVASCGKRVLTGVHMSAAAPTVSGG